jgi:hypothetical protein
VGADNPVKAAGDLWLQVSGEGLFPRGLALEHALTIAEADGAVFAFVLYPAPELLRRHARHSTAYAALIEEILGLLSRNQPGPPRAEPNQLYEPLNEGEAGFCTSCQPCATTSRTRRCGVRACGCWLMTVAGRSQQGIPAG